MGISTSTAPFSLADGSITPAKLGVGTVKMLGSGTYTTTTSAAYEDAGNFSTTADIGQGRIVLICQVSKDAVGAGNSELAIHTASGNAATHTLKAASMDYECIAEIVRSSHTATGYNYNMLTNDSNTTFAIVKAASFDFSAAEQVFIKMKASSAVVHNTLYWTAWLYYE